MKNGLGLVVLVVALTARAQTFNMSQTISDGAQRSTLAFSGVALMTGNLEAQTFFPPGKVADYTGFQYLRDNDPDGMGHNTSFLTRIAYNVIYILNTNQFNQLKNLAVAQQDLINLYGYKRYPLMQAFRQLPDDSAASLDPVTVKQASRELYLIDGQISFDRAVLYANVINSFDADQRAYLDAMKGVGFNSWPDITQAQVQSKMQGLPQGTAVAVMTYAGDLFSWYAGSLDADVYFCPERQGTYYGGFYIKDAPAIGHEGYSIDEQLTATAGAALCDPTKGYVNSNQAAQVSRLVDLQRDNLYAGTSNIVTVRTEIATLLRSLLTSPASSNAVQSQVLALSGIYGDLDGENNYYYATTFAQVYASLSYSQRTNLFALRQDIMTGTYADGTPFDFTVCTNYYLYSGVITDTNTLTPYFATTGNLFVTETNATPFDVVLGRPTGNSIAISVLATNNLEAFCEYTTIPGIYTDSTAFTNLTANVPRIVTLTGLQADTPYYYRLRYRLVGATNFAASVARTLHTQRAPGSEFVFSIQGDSHPERANTMFESVHYSNTLVTAAADKPDFYLTIGDDFSVDNIPTNLINQALVTERYTIQRPYLSLVGDSAPLFLVNGNHEQAALYLYDGTSNNIAVWAQNARNTYFPEPAPDSFYTGNTNVVPHIGLLRNYFAWTWGDALFVVIDPYWGSPTCPDNNYWTGEKRTNLWDVTHGDVQYQWLKKTLEESTAKYKFVFAHHVMGTGRGGIEDAPFYEWGGQNLNGTWGFTAHRPSWALPIHQLMATNHVTIFFQGHDHIFAREQLDGVTYLTLPSPADPTYSLFNADAYPNAVYKANNSGYVRVTVNADRVKVDYVRTYLPAEEATGKTNGMVDYSFTLPPSQPVISAVTSTPPYAGDPITVTAVVTDAVGVASVFLNYSAGSLSVTNQPFLETMATTAVKPWTGTGCLNAWTVTGNYFEQRTNSNYGAGNPCGMQYKGGSSTNVLTAATLNTTSSINATGACGYVEFWLRTLTLDGTDGWTFQLDSGSGYVTRLSELTGNSHDWTKYHYDLTGDELVNGLKMRFQFTGGGTADTDDRIDLDQISVTTVTGGSTWTNVVMTSLGNGVYAATIPAQLAGTLVSYSVTASNPIGLTTTGSTTALVTTYAPVAPFDILLGRPTDTSIAVSVLPTTNLQLSCRYGTMSGIYPHQTTVTNLSAGTPGVLTLNSLLPDTLYYYRLTYRPEGATEDNDTVEHTFRTQRAPGSTFTFAIEADPHYQDNDPAVWQLALANMLADAPDFLIDLGDTFMDEKVGTNALAGALALCREVRSDFFSITGHSVPLFLVNGNHDPELGWLRDGTTNNLAAWGAAARQYYYPCPATNAFYSGNTGRDGYYSFTWGNALFVVLDPFWFTAPKPGTATGGWGWTLGADQYAWLQQTLSASSAQFKFVFLHNLVGGSFDGEARGGVEFARFFEWGGNNADDTSGFATQRPGWPMPIHSLLVSNHVTAVFHGHDHLFVRQQLDGIIYQEIPQPSRTNYNNTNSAAAYGYTTGVLQGNSGHLRVTVTPTNAIIAYVRVFLPEDEGPGKTNRMVSYQYDLQPSADTVGDGIPDWWRAKYFGGDGKTTNAASCATCDATGTGQDNLSKFTADLDPTNTASRLAIIHIGIAANDVELTWVGGVNAWQFLECTPTLSSNQWTAILTNAPPTTVTNSIIHTDAAGETKLFYRLKARR